MARITLRQAAAWCGGSVAEEFENIVFEGANIDSRQIEAGQLFVALEGVRDGHDFIGKAMEKGHECKMGKTRWYHCFHPLLSWRSMHCVLCFLLFSC